jgi:hypothetical protein
MTDKKLQKHMRGTDKTTMQNKMVPKEIAWNETIREGYYKHLNGNTYDVVVSEYRMSLTAPGDSGGSRVGVDNSLFTLLTGTNDQDLWAEIDAAVGSILVGSDFIRADGTIPWIANQSLGGFKFSEVDEIIGKSTGGTPNLTFSIPGASGKITVDVTASGSFIVLLPDDDTVTHRVQGAQGNILAINGSTANPRVSIGDPSETFFPLLEMAGKFGINNIADGLTASAVQGQGNGVITKTLNEYTTVALAGDTATLPIVGTYWDNSNDKGAVIWCKNAGANAMDVFPANSAQIDSLGVNVAFSLAPGESVMFVSTGILQWKSF